MRSVEEKSRKSKSPIKSILPLRDQYSRNIANKSRSENFKPLEKDRKTLLIYDHCYSELYDKYKKDNDKYTKSSTNKVSIEKKRHLHMPSLNNPKQIVTCKKHNNIKFNANPKIQLKPLKLQINSMENRQEEVQEDKPDANPQSSNAVNQFERDPPVRLSPNINLTPAHSIEPSVIRTSVGSKQKKSTFFCCF